MDSIISLCLFSVHESFFPQAVSTGYVLEKQPKKKKKILKKRLKHKGDSNFTYKTNSF